MLRNNLKLCKIYYVLHNTTFVDTQQEYNEKPVVRRRGGGIQLAAPVKRRFSSLNQPVVDNAWDATTLYPSGRDGHNL